MVRVDRPVRVPNDLIDNLTEWFTFEGPCQSAHFIEDTAEHPGITLEIVRLAHADLWWEVEGCAEACIRQLNRVLKLLRDAKVTDFNHVVFCDEDVLRLQIPMQHLVLVDVEKAEAELDEPVEDLTLWEALLVQLCLLDTFLKVTPLAVIHHDAHVVAIDERVKVPYHVQMIQILQHLDLRTKRVKSLFDCLL